MTEQFSAGRISDSIESTETYWYLLLKNDSMIFKEEDLDISMNEFQDVKMEMFCCMIQIIQCLGFSKF